MLANRIKSLRQDKQWNQTELATKIGVGRTTVTEYEAGRIVPPLDKLQAMAKLFDVSVQYLTGETNAKNQPTTDVNDIAEQLASMIDELSNPESSVKFDGDILTIEEKENVMLLIKSALQMARCMNRRTEGEQ